MFNESDLEKHVDFVGGAEVFSVVDLSSMAELYVENKKLSGQFCFSSTTAEGYIRVSRNQMENIIILGILGISKVLREYTMPVKTFERVFTDWISIVEIQNEQLLLASYSHEEQQYG